jgi:hypothetical protein
MSSPQDDELTLLWQQGTSPQPVAEEIARLAARASVRRFDQVIFRRNLMEYVAGFVGAVFFTWLIVAGDKPYDRVQGATGFLCFGVWLGKLWWEHRGIAPLDPTTDARTYQAVMLSRIDKQIRFLSRVHYWGLPIYAWLLASGLVYGITVLDVALLVALYVGVAWLNSRWGVRRLREKRLRIERLYQD